MGAGALVSGRLPGSCAGKYGGTKTVARAAVRRICEVSRVKGGSPSCGERHSDCREWEWLGQRGTAADQGRFFST